MRFREKLALSVPPLLLRLALAATFLWAGIGDVQNRRFTPEDAAILATLKVVEPGAAVDLPTPPETDDDEAPAVEEPAEDDGVVAAPSARLMFVAQADQQDDADEPTDDSESSEADDTAPRSLAGDVPREKPESEAPAEPAPPAFTAEDFPFGAEARGMHRFTVRAYRAANPDSGGGSLPAWLGKGRWPVRIGFLAAAVEIFGAALLLLGLFTRLSALALGVIQAVGLWTVYIAPTALGTDTSSLLGIGALPSIDYTDEVNRELWQTLLWRFGLLMSCLALFCMKPGFSLDAYVFRGKRKNGVEANSED